MPGEASRFIYMQSEILQQKIAYDISTGKVTCKDGTIYGPEEIAIINEDGQAITLTAHTVKRVFQGVIVRGGKET